MKRMWAALVLLVLLIATCVIGIVHTDVVTDRLVQTVTAAKQAQEKDDADSALQFSRQALQEWREIDSGLHVYMQHSKLDAIDQELAALPELCQNGAKDSFLSECDKSLALFSYLNESEVPNIRNIF